MALLKSTSRSIHSTQQEEKKKKKKEAEPCMITVPALTVWRKSLVVSCNGFTVIDSFGNLVYRVDNYKGQTKELILMDAAGQSILTMKRRRPHNLLATLVHQYHTWAVYEGDHHQESPEAAWSVKKCLNINTLFMMSTSAAAGVLAQVYRTTNSGTTTSAAYVVEGSYCRRSCRVLDENKRVVAEIRRKDDDVTAGRGVCFGVDVFQLLVISDALDPAFAMALVVLLDQMFS